MTAPRAIKPVVRRRAIPPRQSRVPQRFEVNSRCTNLCSLNRRNLAIADLVHSWYEAGYTNLSIIERSKALGVRDGQGLSNGAIGRHYTNHLNSMNEMEVADVSEPLPHKIELIPILEQIIGKGAASLRIGTFKVGPETTMKAIELLLKLTQGNAQQTWLDAMEKAIEGSGYDPSSAAVDEIEQASVSSE